uniref:Uncharacterized protein n=1 Tax=Moniliophthora roreri TaxID=221103 RepID=A0A0W0FMQ0_MONRR
MSSEICLWIMEQANDTDFRGPCEVIIHCDNKKWIVNSERMYGHVIDTFPIRDESSTRYQGSKLRTILEFYQEIRGLIENGQTVEEIQGVKKLLEDHAEQKVEAKSIVAMSSLSKSGSPLRSSGLGLELSSGGDIDPHSQCLASIAPPRLWLTTFVYRRTCTNQTLEESHYETH